MALLDEYVIETRRSTLLDSILQKFEPCQLTLLAMHETNMMRQLGKITQPMQIFVEPFLDGLEILSRISKVTENSTYSVLYGHQYTVKFGTPACKLNAAFLARDNLNFVEIQRLHRPFFGSQAWEFTIASNNHPIFRSVYSKKNTFYMMFIDKESRLDSMRQVLDDISGIVLFYLRFWAVTLMPLNEELLKHNISISIWFTALTGTHKYNDGHSDVLLDELTCEADEISYSCTTM